MTSIQTVGSIALKIMKLVLNMIILILYRTGYSGSFLGVGGTWNLNEEKNPDAEIVASGVFVGFFIYTIVSLVALCFSRRDHKNFYTDIIMNIVGMVMWLAVGATALHYWHGYLTEHKYNPMATEKQIGLAMGSLCILQAAVFLLDGVLAGIHYIVATSKE